MPTYTEHQLRHIEEKQLCLKIRIKALESKRDRLKAELRIVESDLDDSIKESYEWLKEYQAVRNYYEKENHTWPSSTEEESV